MNNPFYKTYNTQFEIPPFSEIEEKHYMPAFLKGMEEHNSEINEIIQSPEKPTFDNVIIAMERSGDILDRVSNVFFNLSGSATNIKLQEIEKEISPLLSEHYDSISLNPDIFNKIKLLWEDIDNLELSKEENKMLEESYKNFLRNGALLKGLEKDRYLKINQELGRGIG